MILSSTFAVRNLGSLDNVMSVDIRMTLNRLQGEAVRFPRNKIVGTVH
jgi:hypothetical protein